LTPYDDLPLQQTAEPLAMPASSDQNAYGRYWFGATHREGAYQLEAAFGRYPNLGVADAHLSISRACDGVQHSLHVSGRVDRNPAHTAVGPFRLEITELMRTLRIVVEDNDSGITGELVWQSRIGALLEDHTVMEADGRRIVDMTRFLQFGTWSGHITIDGERVELRPEENVGMRDRSWGVRPVGPQPPRPPSMPSNCWLWIPTHFDEECRSLGYYQQPGGHIWRGDGFVLPVVSPVAAITPPDAPGVVHQLPRGQRLTFEPGTRWISGGEVDVLPHGGDTYTMTLEPMLRFQMTGLGYGSSEWGHGYYKGDLVVGRETWRLDEIKPGDPTAQHTHHAVKVRIGDQVGVGLLEQIIFGPHTQFGFHEFLDGAAG
jgi:hypothetical protein